jgi:endonuclease/exonuclease/phosphatase family metal-dependent hydrolase
VRRAPSGALALGAGLHGVHGPAHLRSSGPFGNAILSASPAEEAWTVDLSVPGREPRAALVARFRLSGRGWTVVATHFGLRPGERAAQVERLLAALPHGDPLVLLADVNAFVPWSPALRRLQRRFGPPAAPASFPARWPALPLDRVWAGDGARVVRGWAHRSPGARVASDHLPVCADVEA